jgi:hypothetical protein
MLFGGLKRAEYHTKCYGLKMNIVDRLIIYKISLMTEGKGGRDIAVNHHFQVLCLTEFEASPF